MEGREAIKSAARACLSDILRPSHIMRCRIPEINCKICCKHSTQLSEFREIDTALRPVQKHCTNSSGREGHNV